MKGNNTESIFSVMCSSDILLLEQYNIIKRLNIFSGTNKSDLPEFIMTSSACAVTSALMLTAAIEYGYIGCL